MNTIFKPEGCLYRTAENRKAISSYEALSEAMRNNTILEARVSVCDSSHNLIVDLPCGKAVIPRDEGAVGISDGTTRDIALISRVNKNVCFTVTDVTADEYGRPASISLSRRNAQLKCMENYIKQLRPGDVIDAKVTHFEKFGCFVDIGCGIPSLIPIDAISVSRISHPSDRFSIGEMIKAVVKSNNNGRICLSHKELLGTWEENALSFNMGETVSGIVRSVEDYGIFVELAPNLAGLAEPKENISVGQNVSVFIKAIIPEKMKVKLIIVDVGDENLSAKQDNIYFFEGTHIDKWIYTPDSCIKNIETVFE